MKQSETCNRRLTYSLTRISLFVHGKTRTYVREIFIARIRDCSKVLRSYLSPSSYGIVPPANSSAWWTSKCRKSCRATSK